MHLGQIPRAFEGDAFRTFGPAYKFGVGGGSYGALPFIKSWRPPARLIRQRMGKGAGLAGLGRMSPEAEAEWQKLKAFMSAQRAAILASGKGKHKKELRAAGFSKRDMRRAKKALKQAYKLGVPLDPMNPVSPVVPPSAGGDPGILFVPPMSTGGGGGAGGAGGAGSESDGGGSGGAGGAGGSSILPIALAAAGLYFLS